MSNEFGAQMPPEVREQLDKVAKRHRLSVDQEELLRHLVEWKFSGLWKNRDLSGQDVLVKYYREIQKDQSSEKSIGDKGRQLILGLRGKLEKSGTFRIPEESRYEPELIARKSVRRSTPRSPSERANLVHLGTNRQAIPFIVRRIAEASLVEDTTVRWEKRQSLWDEGSMASFAAALEANRDVEFRCVMGPILDSPYVRALLQVFDKPKRREFFKCRRLHHTAPLMNFLVTYSRKGADGRQRKAVFFGYGRQMGVDGIDDTAVFFSENEALVKEFRRLFKTLVSDEYSRPVSLSDPELVRTRDHRSDVLATFQGWPDEIAERIRDCRETVRVCITSWSSLHNYVPELEKALRNGKEVTIATWDPHSAFVQVRQGATDTDSVVASIQQNNKVLRRLKKSYPQLQLKQCLGQGSVSIFWIDDLIYFSGYWVRDAASKGPHFLVRADSETGRFLQQQYHEMTESKTVR